MSAVFIGFSSPPVGNTQTLYDVELVKKDLMNHFNTKKGERVMDVEYGCIAWDLIFDLDNQNNKSILDTDIRRIIDTEPRVQLVDLVINSIQGGYEAYINLKYVYLEDEVELYIKFIRVMNEDKSDTQSV